MSRVISLGAACLLLLSAAPARGWESSAKWGGNVVGYLVNPSNLDVTDAQALKAIRSSADAWTEQTQAAFRFRYDGASSVATQGLDGKNLVLFRNEVAPSSATARASTYTWKLLGLIIETDVVFWDKSMTFVTAAMPCTSEIVIENTGIHEFGHALGLDHSTVSTATMWSKSSACSTSRLVLDPDDIAGAEALYPCSSAAQCNDGNPCTSDTCSSKKCLRTAIAGCCTVSADCDDGNPCTKDTCNNNVCKHAASAGCCTKSAQCDDGDPCTKDTCKDNACKHAAVPCDAGAPPADAGAGDGPNPAGDGPASADAIPTVDLGGADPEAASAVDAGAAADGVTAGDASDSTVTSNGCTMAAGARSGADRAHVVLFLLLPFLVVAGRRATVRIVLQPADTAAPPRPPETTKGATHGEPTTDDPTQETCSGTAGTPDRSPG